MTDAECKAIEQECVEKVRKALKLITSAEIYDRKGYLNEEGYKALEEIEGLDLFWICDPLIKLVNKGEWIPVSERLPDDMQKVLIWFEYYRYGDFNCMYQTYGFGYVCDSKWSPFINGETGWQDYNIIAWQPLPEPYKKGGAECSLTKTR